MTVSTFLKTRAAIGKYSPKLAEKYEGLIAGRIKKYNARRVAEYTSSKLPAGQEVPHLDTIARVAKRNDCNVYFSPSENGNGIKMDVRRRILHYDPNPTMNEQDLSNITGMRNPAELSHLSYFTLPSRNIAGTTELNVDAAKNTYMQQVRETIENGLAETQENAFVIHPRF